MAGNDQQHIERQAQKLWQQANEALNAGQPARARPHLEKLVGLIPGDPALRYNLGACLFELGNKSASIRQFEKATKLANDFVEAHFMLGMALVGEHKDDKATAAFTRVLELDPDHSGAAHALGHSHFAAGRYDDALPFLRRAAMSQTAKPVYELGLCLHALGQAEEGNAALRTAVELSPNEPAYRLEFARRLVAQGELSDALSHAREALALSGGGGDVARQFAEIVGQYDFDTFDADVLADIRVCLSADPSTAAELARTALGLLCLEPETASLLARCHEAPTGSSDDLLIDPAAMALMDNPVLLHLMAQTQIYDVRVEAFLTLARQAALHVYKATNLSEAVPVPFLAALAIQAHATEFIYVELAEETVGVDSLETQLTAGQVSALCLYGCYRPLADLADVTTFVAGAAAPPQLETLLARYVMAPLDEREIAGRLPELTPIENHVSAGVRDQYDQNPYPRWFEVPAVDPRPVSQHLNQMFPHLEPSVALIGNPDILIAGCGSGLHAALTATMFPDSEILAIDLSRVNLAYAARQLAARKLTNVSLGVADILALHTLDRTFPMVESVGVLHHLGDPEAGWRVLVDLTAPGGVMHIALYSEIARRELIEAKRMISDGGYEATRDGISAFRQEVIALPDDDPVREILVSSRDFYSVSSCRDLLFHVQEHLFTVSRLRAALDELGLEFLGFQLARPQFATAYREMFPDDPNMVSLDHWEVFENQHPETFRSMYDFYCRKPNN